MIDVERYLGRPWVADSFNCWELLREFYARELKILLPGSGIDGNDLPAVCNAFAGHDLYNYFERIDAPVNGCAVLMRHGEGKRVCHCGVYLTFNGAGYVLHNWRGAGVLLDSVNRISWHLLTITGFYQYRC